MKCANPDCGKEFKKNKPWHIYCCEKCRKKMRRQTENYKTYQHEYQKRYRKTEKYKVKRHEYYYNHKWVIGK